MSLTIEVIIPGPVEKKKIEKTAAQIAKTPAFREKLISRPEFSFLLDDHRFNPFYLQALEKCKAELANVIEGHSDHQKQQQQQQNHSSSSSAAAASAGTTIGGAKNTVNQNNSDSSSGPLSHAPLSNPSDSAITLRDTLPDDFSIPVTASGIPALEIDLIQLAAQHAAVYGDLFVQRILARSSAKQRSLEFLNPDHSHHHIFVKIRDAYIKILGALATELHPVEANIIAGSRDVKDVPPAHVTRGQNDLVTRMELLAGELVDSKNSKQNSSNNNQNVANDEAEAIRRGREAFLIECNAKKNFMLQEDTKRRNAQMSDAELIQRLNWEQFVVKHSFSFEDLKLKQ